MRHSTVMRTVTKLTQKKFLKEDLTSLNFLLLDGWERKLNNHILLHRTVSIPVSAILWPDDPKAECKEQDYTQQRKALKITACS